MSKNLVQIIKQAIELSQVLLEGFNAYSTADADDEKLAIIIEQSKQRERLLAALFSSYAKDQLAHYPTQLSEIASLDQQLLVEANALKNEMAKRVIKQKKNTKATNAYLSP